MRDAVRPGAARTSFAITGRDRPRPACETRVSLVDYRGRMTTARCPAHLRRRRGRGARARRRRRQLGGRRERRPRRRRHLADLARTPPAHRRPRRLGRGRSLRPTASTFEPVTEVSREAFGAESFERPVLVPLREGGWRLYLSCATPAPSTGGSTASTADTVEGLPDGVRRRVHEGDRRHRRSRTR